MALSAAGIPRVSTLIDKDSAENIALLHAAAKTGFIPPIKTSVFRYVSMRTESAWQYFEQTVSTNTLPMTTPIGFNDPFDVSPNVINDLSSKDIDAVLGDTDLYRSDETARQIAALPPDGKKTLQNLAVEILRGQIMKIHRSTKIASFSQRISSELLWAHYADSYRGMAYHFVTSGDPNSVFHHLKPVQYVGQRPIVPMTAILETSKQEKFTARRALMLKNIHEGFFLHKSLEWAYEQEMRVVLTGRKEQSFRPEELASLILGPYFPNEAASRIARIIGSRDRPIRVLRAELSKTDYSIDIGWHQEIEL